MGELCFNKKNFDKLNKRVKIIRKMSKGWKDKYHELYKSTNSGPSRDKMCLYAMEMIRLYMQDQEEGVSTKNRSLYEFWCWIVGDVD